MDGWSRADTIILIVLFLFGAIGALRGFIRSLLGIVAVAAGFTVAAIFYKDGATWIAILPMSFQLRCVIAFLLLMFFSYAFLSIIFSIFRGRPKLLILSIANRIFGFCLGFLRGILILIVLAFVGLLSPVSEQFYAWASHGYIGPYVLIGAKKLSTQTLKTTQELHSKFIQQMLAWGVKEPFLEKIFVDPELMKEMVKQGDQNPPPSSAITAPPQILYDQMQQVIENDMLNSQQKAREIWRLVLSAQQSNPETIKPNEPPAHNKKKP